MTRTYSEVMWSGALPPTVADELVRHVAASRSVFTMPSDGGGNWCTFAMHGWGYGLLLYDMIDRYLLFTYAMAS